MEACDTLPMSNAIYALSISNEFVGFGDFWSCIPKMNFCNITRRYQGVYVNAP